MTKKWVSMIGLAVLVATLATGGAMANTVPDVRGLTLSAATTAIQNAGLVLFTPVSYGKSVSYPYGQVYRQDPASGATADAGSKVKIIVSQGPPFDPAKLIFGSTSTEGWGTNPLDGSPVKSFCQAQQAIVDNSLITLLPPEFMDLLDLFRPETGDLNGTSYVIIANPYPDGDLSFNVGGNGWLDCSVDLILIEAILKNASFSIPAHDSYAGLTYAAVFNALSVNAEQFGVDIGSYWGLMPSLLNGLPQILLGHTTIGGGSATFSEPVEEDFPYNRIDATGSGGIMQAILTALGTTGFIANPAIDIGDYVSMPAYFAQTGDADGDGASNICEYNYVVENFPSDVQAKYVEYALDPSKVGECPVSLFCLLSQTGDRMLTVGAPLNLSVVVGNALGVVTYTWTKDGAPIGANSSTYSKEAVELDDAGVYVCTASDMSKAVVTATMIVKVYPAGTLPVGAPIALGALVGMLLGCGGLAAFRKRS